MTTSYHIVFKENDGGFNSAAISESVECETVQTVSRYNGRDDFAIIKVPRSNETCIERYLDDDDNVIEYRSFRN